MNPDEERALAETIETDIDHAIEQKHTFITDTVYRITRNQGIDLATIGQLIRFCESLVHPPRKD